MTKSNDVTDPVGELSEWMCELHVGENGNEDDGFAVHFLIDPGDGLCSTLADHLSEADARFIVAACNSHFELLGALKCFRTDFNSDGSYSDAELVRRAAIAKAEGAR